MIILLNTKINQTKVVFEDNNVKKKYTMMRKLSITYKVHSNSYKKVCRFQNVTNNLCGRNVFGNVCGNGHVA